MQWHQDCQGLHPRASKYQPQRGDSAGPGTRADPLLLARHHSVASVAAEGAPRGAMPTTCLSSLLLLPFANMAGEEGTEQVLVPVSAEAPRDAINS